MPSTPIIHVQREKKEDSSLKDMMMMQALMQAMGGVSGALEKYTKDAEEKKFRNLEFMMKTGIDPDTMQPVSADKLSPAMQNARGEAATRAKILRGESLSEQEKQSLGMVKDEPSAAEIRLSEMGQQTQRDISAASLAAQKEISGAETGSRERIAGAETGSRERIAQLGSETEKNVAGLKADTELYLGQKKQSFEEHMAELDRKFKDRANKRAEKYGWLSTKARDATERRGQNLIRQTAVEDMAVKMAGYAEKDKNLGTIMQLYRDKNTKGEQKTILWGTIVKAYEAKDPEIGKILRQATEASQQEKDAGWFGMGQRDDLLDSILHKNESYEKEAAGIQPAPIGAKPLQNTPGAPVPAEQYFEELKRQQQQQQPPPVGP
jgi:hypothetical protein